MINRIEQLTGLLKALDSNRGGKEQGICSLHMKLIKIHGLKTTKSIHNLIHYALKSELIKQSPKLNPSKSKRGFGYKPYEVTEKGRNFLKVMEMKQCLGYLQLYI